MIEYNIAITNQQETLALDEKVIRRTVRSVLQDAGIIQATVSVAIVDNETIRELKTRFFDLDEVTDVISFDLRDNHIPENKVDCEVVINAQRACELADDDKAAIAEVHLYIVHGLLHQLGFDDDTLEHAQAMHAKEDDILNRLNFGGVFRQQTGNNIV